MRYQTNHKFMYQTRGKCQHQFVEIFDIFILVQAEAAFWRMLQERTMTTYFSNYSKSENFLTGNHLLTGII